MYNPVYRFNKLIYIDWLQNIINSAEFYCFYCIVVKGSNKYNIKILLREMG